jgi:hypothetical protein
MEYYEFVDDSESSISDHFSKIFQQKEKSKDEIKLSLKLELTHKEVDEEADQDSPKYEFSFDMFDIDKVEFEAISHWAEFLLHGPKQNSFQNEFDVDSKNYCGSDHQK